MKFTNEFEAAGIISTEGMAGANKAAQLVGISTTITLLAYRLKEEGSGDAEILETLKHSGLTQIAEISYGRCIIWDEDFLRLVAAFEIHRKETGEAFCASIPVAGLNGPMWMSGVQLGLFARNPPYTEIQEILLERHRQLMTKLGLPST